MKKMHWGHLFMKLFKALAAHDLLLVKNSRTSHLNRPLALRGHMTNASFKQWVGILLMPKIVRARKNYLSPEIWEETHLREIFYGSLIFQQSSMICIGRHVGGQALLQLTMYILWPPKHPLALFLRYFLWFSWPAHRVSACSSSELTPVSLSI